MTIAASAGPNGSISPTSSVVVKYGESQEFTISPDTGYYIADVKSEIDGHRPRITDYGPRITDLVLFVPPVSLCVGPLCPSKLSQER